MELVSKRKQVTHIYTANEQVIAFLDNTEKPGLWKRRDMMPGDTLVTEDTTTVIFLPTRPLIPVPQEPQSVPDHISADHLESLCNILQNILYTYSLPIDQDTLEAYREAIIYGRSRMYQLRFGTQFTQPSVVDTSSTVDEERITP